MKKIILTSAVTAALSAAVIQAEANTSGSAATGSEVSFIEEIVVTARKRQESLQEVPLSITAFSAAALEAKSLTGLKELSQFTPNFSMFNDGNDGSLTSNVVIRGIGSSIGGPGVGMYQDGVYLGTSQGIDLDLMDVERVEVLRGPQGTLFGRNTIGGAVNLVTKRPTGELSGDVEMTLGRYDRLDAKINVNVPLIENKLNAKIAIGSQKRDGYGRILDYATGKEIDDMGDRDRVAGRVLLDWIASESINVLFSVDAMELDEKSTVRSLAGFTPTELHSLYNMFFMPEPPLDSSIQAPDSYSSYGAGNNFNEMDSVGGSITIDWDLGDTFLGSNTSIKSISSKRSQETGFGVDFDFSPHVFTTADNFSDHEQFSQEIQLSALSFNEKLVWVLGLYYYEDESEFPSTAQAFIPLSDAGFIPDFGFNLLDESESDSFSVFSQGTYNVTERFSITAGLRYTEDNSENTTQQTSLEDGSFNCAACLPPITGEASSDEITGRLSFEYAWTEDLMTFASAAKGYKTGGLTGAVTSTSASVASLNEFLPETVWTYEMGFRSTWLSNRLRVNATAFFTDYEDIQYSFVFTQNTGGVVSPIEFVSNGPEAEIKGVELDVLYSPIEDLTISASYGLTDGEYLKGDPNGGPLTKDSEFVNTPKNSFTFAVEYSMATDIGELSANIDYAWNDKIYFEIEDTVDPRLQQDSYGLLNARVSLAMGSGLTLSIFGTNLEDKEYLHSAFAIQDIGLDAIHQPAVGREWGVTANYQF